MAVARLCDVSKLSSSSKRTTQVGEEGAEGWGGGVGDTEEQREIAGDTYLVLR